MRKLLALLLLIGSVGVANAQTTCTSTLNQTAVLSSFADNSTQGITARNLRDYVCSSTAGSIIQSAFTLTGTATFADTSTWGTAGIAVPVAQGLVISGLGGAGGPSLILNNKIDSCCTGFGPTLYFNGINASHIGANTAYINCGYDGGGVGTELGLCDYALFFGNVPKILTMSLVTSTNGCFICTGGAGDGFWDVGQNGGAARNIWARQVILAPPAAAPIIILSDIDTTSGNQINFENNGTLKWQLGTNGTNNLNFFIFDPIANQTVLNVANNGNLTLSPKGITAVTGHLNSTNPSGLLPTVSNCGAGAITGGSDTAGQVTEGGSGVTSCTILFRTAYSNQAICNATIQSGVSNFSYTITNSGFNITHSAATSAVINFMCMGS